MRTIRPGWVVGVAAAALLAGSVLPSPSSAATLPPFESSVQRIDEALKARMAYSWRPGCPVPRWKLRYVTVSFVGFRGGARRGELVVHRNQAEAVVGVFERLYELRFPIRRMRLVDDYLGDDDSSMAANNTSAFNCRRRSNGTTWSEHAYGRAIDINPVQNPYVYRGVADPPAGAAYVDRSPLRKGMVTRGVRRAFSSVGWSWGGDWTGVKDYQHFSATGR